MPDQDETPIRSTAHMNRAWASVVSIRAGRSGLSRALCRLDDGTEAEAVGYPELVGTIAEGDRVLLNTTAVDLALGSGGVHFIIARDSDPGESRESTGHIVKLRYTPHQMALLAVEEPASEFHSAIETADSLAGMPVVCCELVSQVPAVIAGLRSRGEPGRIALTVSDEAALPAQYSDLMMDLRSGGFVCSVITAGQAFGGDLEAVNVHSALLAARIACGAAFAIVTPGPGTVGTGTKWGFSGVRQGEAINAIAALEGRPIGVVRASGAEARGRHTGISHHTRTVFTRVATAPFSAAWPAGFASRYAEAWCSLCAETGPRISGYIVEGATEALQSFENDWRAWKTMGRGRSEDPLYYEAAAAAGILAMNLRREANCE